MKTRRANRFFSAPVSANALPQGKATPSGAFRICVHPRPSAVKRGFTIIEIMTAMAIFCMVVAAIFASWQAIMRGSISGKNAAVRAQRSRVALRQLQEALGGATSYVADIDYYTFEAENGNEPYLSFVSRLPPDFLRNSRFGDSNLRRVTFSLEQGNGRDKSLVMRQSPVLMDMRHPGP